MALCLLLLSLTHSITACGIWQSKALTELGTLHLLCTVYNTVVVIVIQVILTGTNITAKQTHTHEGGLTLVLAIKNTHFLSIPHRLAFCLLYFPFWLFYFLSSNEDRFPFFIFFKKNKNNKQKIKDRKRGGKGENQQLSFI